MRDFRLEGIGSISGGEYDSVILSGIIKGNGDVTANYIKTEGMFTHKSSITILNEAYLKGTASVSGNMRANQLKLEGILKIKDGTLVCNEISAEGMIVCSGEIYANETIKVDGNCTAGKIAAKNVNIKTSDAGAKYVQAPNKWIDSISSGIFGENVSIMHSTVGEIECENLTAVRLKCDIIHADSVDLRNHCVIGKLHCSGEIKADSTCEIGEVIGNDEYAASNTAKTNTQTEEIKVPQTQNLRNDILNILNMVKDNAVDPEKAVDMIAASAYVNSMQRAAKSTDAGFDVDIDWKDDDKLHIAAFIGHKFVKKGIFNSVTNDYTVHLEGGTEIRDVDCRGHLVCGNVGGNVSAGSSVKSGDVQGSISAGSSVTCGNVGKNVSAGATVKCGAVTGNVTAGGGVKIN